MKIAKFYDTNPEDTVNSTDRPPKAMSEVICPRRRRGSALGSGDNHSGSFTSVVVDSIIRRGSGAGRTQSDYDTSAPNGNNAKVNRWATYALGMEA